MPARYWKHFVTALLALALLSLAGATAVAQEPDPRETAEVEGTTPHGEPLELPYADSPYEAEAVDLPEAENVGSPEYWTITPTGFVRVGYTWVQERDDADDIGRNNGFELANARFGVLGIHDPSGISFRVTAEGALDLGTSEDAPQAQFGVRLRDAWIAFYPNDFLGVQVGQFNAPFSAEGLRSRSQLMFIDRAVGEYGIPVGTGLRQDGIGVGRELGVMVAAPQTMRFGAFGLHYALMLANGNGPNQLRNDSNKPALFGRVELSWEDLIRLGVGASWNPRVVGDEPDREDETDTSVVTDVTITWEGLEAYGQFIHTNTQFGTTGEPSRSRVAYHAQAGYEVFRKEVGMMPAFRYGYLERLPTPADTGTSATYDVRHYTATFRVRKQIDPIELRTFIEYTRTSEEGASAQNNNAYRLLMQLSY